MHLFAGIKWEKMRILINLDFDYLLICIFIKFEYLNLANICEFKEYLDESKLVFSEHTPGFGPFSTF